MYLVPQIAIFDDKWHNMRLYGELMLILLACIVAVGVKLVSPSQENLYSYQYHSLLVL